MYPFKVLSHDCRTGTVETRFLQNPNFFRKYFGGKFAVAHIT